MIVKTQPGMMALIFQDTVDLETFFGGLGGANVVALVA